MINREKLARILDVLPGKTRKEDRLDLILLKKKFSRIFDELESLKSSLTEVSNKIVPQKLDPRIPVLEEKIDSIEIPEPIDLEPVNKKLKELESKFIDTVSSFQKKVVENPPEFPDYRPDIDSLTEKIEKLKNPPKNSKKS